MTRNHLAVLISRCYRNGFWKYHNGRLPLGFLNDANLPEKYADLISERIEDRMFLIPLWRLRRLPSRVLLEVALWCLHHLDRQLVNDLEAYGIRWDLKEITLDSMDVPDRTSAYRVVDFWKQTVLGELVRVDARLLNAGVATNNSIPHTAS